MYFSFLDAFADYPVNFRLTKEQFVRKFVEKLKIEFNLSVGAFDYEAMAGFIFTTVNFYQEKLTAYNGGTGVRPSYRGYYLTRHMYDYLVPKFKDKGITQCVLEVLVNNTGAIKVYQQIGFEIKGMLCSFKSPEELRNNRTYRNSDLDIRQVLQPTWSHYTNFHNFKPSFLDTPIMISKNIANEVILEARINGELAGYVIYQPAFARLSQLAINPEYRRLGIGSELISHILNKTSNKELTIINVREQDQGTMAFFKSLGFINHINQYEMVLPLAQ